MKKYAILTAIAFFAASAPAFASCDTRKEDDQAVCAGKCEDIYVRNNQNNMADHTQLKSDRRACDEKCGCAENSKNL